MFDLEGRITRHPVTTGLALALADANAVAPSPLLCGRKVAGPGQLLPVACLLVRDLVVMPLAADRGLVGKRDPERVARVAYLLRGLFEGKLAVPWQGGRDDPGSHGAETWSRVVAAGLGWLATRTNASAVSASATRDLAHFKGLALVPPCPAPAAS